MVDRTLRDPKLFEAGKCKSEVKFKTALAPDELRVERPGFWSKLFGGRDGAAYFTMYDDVNALLVPSNAYACAFYVGGVFANYSAMRSHCPRAILAPTMLRWPSTSLKTLPDWEHGVSWDIEPSLFTPAQAGALVRMTRAEGVFPHIYCPLGVASVVMQYIHAAGFSRSQFKLHTAHWTYQPHVCGGIPSPWGITSADATQYTDSALGLTHRLDASLCRSDYLQGGGPVPTPSTFPLKAGSKGSQVKQVQKALDVRGFHLTADGAYGPLTTGAVKEWQRNHQRHVTGEINHDDWDFMFPVLSIKSHNDWPGATEALQRALNKTGYRLGSIPYSQHDQFGYFGTPTEGAVKQYQHQHRLTADGVVGPKTWVSLL